MFSYHSLFRITRISLKKSGFWEAKIIREREKSRNYSLGMFLMWVVVVVLVGGLGHEGSLIYVLNGRDSLCPSTPSNQQGGRAAARIIKPTSLS